MGQIELLKMYNGNIPYILVFIAAFICICVLEKDKARLTAFAVIPGIILVMLLNPLFGNIIDKYEIVSERIVRMYWMIPGIVITAYGAVLLINRIDEKIKGAAGGAFAAVIAILIIIGIPEYGEGEMELADNIYKLSPDTIEMVDMIKEHAKTVQIDDPKCILPLDEAAQARQYDGSLHQLYGRYPDRLGDDTLFLYETYSYNRFPDLNVMSPVLLSSGCDYVVLRYDYGGAEAMMRDDVESIGQVGDYCIFFLTDKFRGEGS